MHKNCIRFFFTVHQEFGHFRLTIACDIQFVFNTCMFNFLPEDEWIRVRISYSKKYAIRAAVR